MTDTTTTTPDLLAEAQRLEALIDEHAAEGDERGRLSDPVVDALHDAGIFGMWVPKALGGSELDPVSSLKVIDQLVYADPSTGWVSMAAGLAIGTGGAYLGDQAVEEIFGGERFPVIAGQGTRPGTAVAQDGGHLLSGSWQFASGIKHSGFIHTLGVVGGHRRAAHLRPPGRAGDADRQLGRDGAARDGQHRLRDRLGLRPRALLALRRHRDPGARRRPLPPRDHQHRRHLPLGLGARDRAAPDGRALEDGAGQGGPARARWARTRASRRASRAPRGSGAPPAR